MPRPARKLMVVAHPDDESIFGGAQLLDGSSWDVVSVTGNAKPKRALEQQEATQRAGVTKLHSLSHPDAIDHRLEQDILYDELKNLLSQNAYDQVVTHNPDGEYFHPQHQAVYEVVASLFDDTTYVFCRSDSALPEDVLEAKQQLLGAYPSQAGIIHSIMHRFGLDFTQLTGARCLDHIRHEGIIYHRAFESQTRFVSLEARRPGLAAALVDDLLAPQFGPKYTFDDLYGVRYPQQERLLRALEGSLIQTPSNQDVLLAWSSEVASSEVVARFVGALGFHQTSCYELSQIGKLPRVDTALGKRSPNVQVWSR